VAPWTTPPTAEAVVGDASLLLVVAAAEALADEVLAGGVLAGGVLDAGVLAGGVLWGDVLVPVAVAPVPPAAAVEPTAEPVADPAEEATDDTADEAAEATDDTTPSAAWPVTPGGAVPEAEATGFCAADAGWAKITVRIKPSTKVTARPPQAYKHARSVQAPTFDSPTLERVGAFPSTAGKARQAPRTSQWPPKPVTRR
jgi:hypothetical protein